MTDAELIEQATADLVELEKSGAGMPFLFKPSEAFHLLAVLQLALRYPGLTGAPGEFAKGLAQNIEKRIGVTPALAEMARRGWETQYDKPAGAAEAAPAPNPAPPAAHPEPRRTGRGRAAR